MAEIPEKIKQLIGEKCAKKDEIGMSGATVYLLDSMVLKVQECGEIADTEYKMMQWLWNKLPVPEILAYEKTNKLSYLLMSRCAGEMSCDIHWLTEPKNLCERLAQVLQSIWEIDISDCPSDCTLEQKLRQAEYNVVHGLVDTENADPNTFSAGGFKDPEALLHWLQCNIPSEELVLSHGDFCLPNIMLKDNRLSGLIDLGRAGIADKWCDIALCYRSLKDNCDGKYSGEKISSFCSQYLFDALELYPDWDKLRYYLLLDELF